MTSKAAFTDEEWFLLYSTPSLVGSAVASAGRSGIRGTMREMMANIETISAGANSFPDNQLITALVARDADKEAARAKAKAYQEKAIAKMQAAGVDGQVKLVEQMFVDIEASLALLTEKATPAEVADYRAWLLSVANNVAEAAKEGGFLGFGGEQVSEEEAALLSQLEAVLTVASP